MPFFVLKGNRYLLKILSNFLLGLHFATLMNFPTLSLYAHTTVYAPLLKNNGAEIMFMTHCTPQQKTAWETKVSQIHIGCLFCGAKLVFFLRLTKQSTEIVWFLSHFFAHYKLHAR